MRERLGRGKRLEQAAAARDAVLEVLLEQVEIPLPETVVTDELNARRQSVEQQLAYAGMTMEKYLEDEGQTLEEFEADLERRVRDAVAAQFILDEVAKKEELGVEQDELSQHLVRRAQQSGQDPQEFANHMFEHNHIPELVQEILRGKALATIVETASVKDASGNAVELKNLRPDGTIGEPEAEVEARGRGHARRLSAQACTRWASLPAMTRGPGVLDALSLLSEVADELVVRTVRDTHLARAPTGPAAEPMHRGHRHRRCTAAWAPACARPPGVSTGWPRPAPDRGWRTEPRAGSSTPRSTG